MHILPVKTDSKKMVPGNGCCGNFLVFASYVCYLTILSPGGGSARAGLGIGVAVHGLGGLTGACATSASP